MSSKNPLVFLDVSIDGDPIERMVFELFWDIAPKTSENFRALCTGEKEVSQKSGKPLHYKGSFFHHILKGSVAQGGDFLKRNGSCGESIYEGKFPEEAPKLKHDRPGLLSMAIADRDTRGSLFIVTFSATLHLDRKNVVFGKLVQGFDVLKKMENMGDEGGVPTVTVKIVNCGEFGVGGNQSSDKKTTSKIKMLKDAAFEDQSNEARLKRKRKKVSKERRKRRRRDYSTESDSSLDTGIEISEYDSDYDFLSPFGDSSSSDYWREKRRKYKRARYKRWKRKERRRERKRRKRDKKLKRKSKRASDRLADGECESEGTSKDNGEVKKPDGKDKEVPMLIVGNQVPLAEDTTAFVRDKGGVENDTEREEGECSKENGDLLSNGIDMGNGSEKSPEKWQSDVLDDHPVQFRSRSKSPVRVLSKSMSISPARSLSKSPDASPRHHVSREHSASQSPPPVLGRSKCAVKRSVSSGGSSKSPVRNVSRSPLSHKKVRDGSPSPVRSSTPSPPHRILSRSPPRTSSRKSSRKSMSRSPFRSPRRNPSRSPVRSSRRSKSPKRSSRRSLSRSSGRIHSRRSRSRSPVRAPLRKRRSSYSRSPVGGGQRARSPRADRGRSRSRSHSPDGSPRRIRRGRGFSDRYSYARRYQTPDHSPGRSYRNGKSDRDRYSSYRGSPRHRSPHRERTPPRYRSRRSRTRSRSVSRSPARYRGRRYSRSRSPVDRYRPSDSNVERRKATTPRSRSPPSRSKSPVEARSPKSLSPKRTSKARSISRSRSVSSSRSPPAEKGLVSYGGDGTPDSGQK